MVKNTDCVDGSGVSVGLCRGMGSPEIYCSLLFPAAVVNTGDLDLCNCDRDRFGSFSVNVGIQA